MKSVLRARFTAVAFFAIAIFTSSAEGRPQGPSEATPGQKCAEAIAQSSGSHIFRRVGETIEIPITPIERDEASTTTDTYTPSTECYPISIELRWANGRMQGGIFRVTYLDRGDQPLFARDLSAFMVGGAELPVKEMGAGKSFGRSMFSMPAKITIQTREPFKAPASVSYSVVWVEPKQKHRTETDVEGKQSARATRTENVKATQTSNEVVRVRSVDRLIGSSRVPLVQLELRAAQPFPVREQPLQLRIGERVFLTELSGDYTGRLLTLSLTPEMFAELEDGTEIVAFFDRREAWSFGKLQKSLLSKK